MAPRTRRSAPQNVFRRISPNPRPGTPQPSIAGNTLALPKPRGRPPKVSPTTTADSVSNATTSSTNINSDSEYSTPATSNAVTPAPSARPKAASGLSATRSLRSSRLEIELPSESEDDEPKPKGFSRVKRTQRSKNSVVGDSEDDELGSGMDLDDPSVKLARRLQREEDHGAALALAASPDYDAPSSSGTALRRSTRATRQPMAVDDFYPELDVSDDENSYAADSMDEDEDIDEDASADDSDEDAPSTPTAADRKGKGKAKPIAQRTTTKRSRATKRSRNTTAIASDDDDSNALGLLELSKPARKKRRANDSQTQVTTDTGPVTLDSEVGYRDVEDPVGRAGMDCDDIDAIHGIPTEIYHALVAPKHRPYHMQGHELRMWKERRVLEYHHPELKTMWTNLEATPVLKATRAEQPRSINRILKPFQLEGLAWMQGMEKTRWKGGLLGDEMGLGKTIQAVSLIMSDYPAKMPSLVLVPPVALMQWTNEINSYTDGRLKTLVFHSTVAKSKNMTAKQLKTYDVILMSYNSLESIYRKQEKGFKRVGGWNKEKSLIHQLKFHRIILDEAHCIKTRTTMTAKACFALKSVYRWCLSGTPLQNRIGEFFSLIRFLDVPPFSSYLCMACDCSIHEWNMNDDGNCVQCEHHSMRHVSVFNHELLNPIQKYGNTGKGKEAFQKLRLLTDRMMLRRLKKDHTNSMELPVKEINIDRQFFGEEENDFASSIMTSGQRKFDTYVAQGVLLNNYANIFGLLMQMRQVADHPDLILKRSGEGGQNIMVCCICDEPAEEAIRSKCKHDFCRTCAATYVHSQEQPDCPRCHIPLSIDLEQPEIEQEEALVKKSSIINRIKMANWTSSSKIELLVHDLHRLRSNNASHKSIIFSQFTTMLQLIEWRLRRAGITTVMLDGSMTPAQRQASINHFMKDPDVECFLVSLKAGGVALNLTEASQVFIVDPWWNPAAEWQSADRCHRIGQTRPCTITRLCIEDSVESRMVLLQEKKANMIKSTINSDDSAMESLTAQDLQFLFRGN